MAPPSSYRSIAATIDAFEPGQDDDVGHGCQRSCGGVWDPLGSACFQPSGKKTIVNWKYVGGGKGGYEKMTSMKYVGENSGGFQREARCCCCRAKSCGFCCGGALLIIFTLTMLALIFGGTETGSSKNSLNAAIASISSSIHSTFNTIFSHGNQTSFDDSSNDMFVPALDDVEVYKASRAKPGPFEYDCALVAGNDDVSEWGIDRRIYCCSKFGVKCNSPLPQEPDEVVSPDQAPTEFDISFDCTAGLDQWSSDWSQKKMRFCCKEKNVGCSNSIPDDEEEIAAESFDCEAAVSSWDVSWSSVKKKWCCSKQGIACDPYNCANLVDLEKWTPQKSKWCCDHQEKGCQTKSTEHFACSLGLLHWQDGWSDMKKVWCCDNEQVGCEDLTHMKAFDCNLNVDNWVKQWSAGKKSWCCQEEGLACEPTTTTTQAPHTSPFDCDEGYEYWESRWSVQKKIWCCKERGRGCATLHAPRK